MRPNAEIILYNSNVLKLLVFDNIEINTSVNNITQTASFTIPKRFIELPTENESNKIYLLGKNHKEELKYGSPVDISLYYEEQEPMRYYNTFYFAGIEVNGENVKVLLEDEMYNYKRGKRFKFTKTNITLKDLVKELGIYSEGNNYYNIIDFTIPKLVLNDYLTPVEILQMLKEQYGFYVYYLNKVIHIGFKYSLSYFKTRQRLLKPNARELLVRNVFSYPYIQRHTQGYDKYVENSFIKTIYPIVKHSLKRNYIPQEVLHIVSVLQSDGTRFYYYTSDGMNVQYAQDKIPETITKKYDIKRTLNLSNIDRESAINTLYNFYDKMPRNKISGELTVFGFPIVYITDSIKIIFEGQSDNVLINEVTYKLNTKEGFKQKIKIN